jgi:hypothetical protein
MDDEVRAAIEMCRSEEDCIELFRLFLRKGLTPDGLGVAMFKVRDPDGKFSTGGGWPDFTKKGKTWTGTGPLRSHFTQSIEKTNYSRAKRKDTYDDCEVVEYRMIEVATYPCRSEALPGGRKKRG